MPVASQPRMGGRDCVAQQAWFGASEFGNGAKNNSSLVSALGAGRTGGGWEQRWFLGLVACFRAPSAHMQGMLVLPTGMGLRIARRKALQQSCSEVHQLNFVPEWAFVH